LTLAQPADLNRNGHADAGVPRYDVVVPTVGRSSLPTLLASLRSALPASSRVMVVDDRPSRRWPLLPDDLEPALDDPRIEVVASGPAGGRGPAAARNTGWRRSGAEWVVFVDDDVDLPVDWVRTLEDDLCRAGPGVAAVQSRLHVPLPPGRQPTDWERNVQGLETAPWITADLAMRRCTLVAVGGFDERFPRAYREDSELALRVLDAGWRLERGRRQVRHPVRPAPWWISVPLQRGNADDVLLERLHGRTWRQRLDVPPGTYAAHRVTVAAAGMALAAGLGRRRHLALAAAGWWTWRTARFAWARIAPGPRTASEVLAMMATSIAIPPAAVVHRAAGRLRWRSHGAG
jgi:Glycosyl transferase family 2